MADHQSARLRPAPLFAVLAVLSAASMATAITAGSVNLTPAALWNVLTGAGDELSRTVILDLRGPRVLAAFAVGGLLSLAGALMQVLLRNPLADPYVLGVSGGAAAGALAALAVGAGGAVLTGSAALGAVTSTLVVYALGRGSGPWDPARLLLTGVIVAAGWGAVIAAILALSPAASVKGMLFWLMGDLGYAESPRLALAALAMGMAIALPLARPLNILSRGERQAAALGIAVRPLRILLYFTGALLTAAAVSTAGAIGFVGLVVPHLLRLVGGSDLRVVLPGAVLLGGSLLTIADTLARSIAAPQQLPVGVITAALGVPAFLVLLRSRRC